jgi:hypothetical protein
MTVFWVVAPCSLGEVYRRFKGACCLHHQGDEGRVVWQKSTNVSVIALMIEAEAPLKRW